MSGTEKDIYGYRNWNTHLNFPMSYIADPPPTIFWTQFDSPPTGCIILVAVIRGKGKDGYSVMSLYFAQGYYIDSMNIYVNIFTA